MVPSGGLDASRRSSARFRAAQPLGRRVRGGVVGGASHQRRVAQAVSRRSRDSSAIGTTISASPPLPDRPGTRVRPVYRARSRVWPRVRARPSATLGPLGRCATNETRFVGCVWSGGTTHATSSCAPANGIGRDRPGRGGPRSPPAAGRSRPRSRRQRRPCRRSSASTTPIPAADAKAVRDVALGYWAAYNAYDPEKTLSYLDEALPALTGEDHPQRDRPASRRSA